MTDACNTVTLCIVKRILIALLFLPTLASAQIDSADADARSENYSWRKWLIGAGTAAGYGGSFVFLNEAWYKNYPRSGFHFFDDSGEWMQIDKLGHVWTAYQTSRLTSEMWKWAGVPENKAVLLGSGSSLLYMLSIEYLDGRSAEWGWSWADAGADIAGAALYATQQLAWSEQKLQIKFSAFPKNYEASLNRRVDDLYGNSFQGRLLKDYNAQTYWLSANIKSFLPQLNFPQWLNVSVGYGAEGMFGGYENIAYDKNGNLTFDRRDIKRYRQWFLAPDVDFTRIKTNSKFLKTAFVALNVLKFPAPAIEFSNGKFRVVPIAY